MLAIFKLKKVRSDIDSESDRFSDAKDNLQSTTHSPSRPDHSDDSDTDLLSNLSK